MKIIQTFVNLKIIVSMVLFFNKWFGFSLFSAFLLIGGNNEVPGTRSAFRDLVSAHPFHVSVIEINHNAVDRTLEISCKIFTDDFEKSLAKNYKTKVDLINPPNKAAMDTLVKKYLYSHLTIKANGKTVVFNYLGFENDHEAAYGYIEVPDVPAVNIFDIHSSIMFDMFEDQMNIFHVTVGGKRKSTKLNYPDRDVVISF
jgi:hypothetical protein